MPLPPFPVDDQSLDLIDRALNQDGASERSSITDLCQMYSQLSGTDPTAVADTEHGVDFMRDPEYGPNDIIAALVAEVRRYRAKPEPEVTS